MSKLRFFQTLMLICAAALMSGPASAQNYPSKPIRVLTGASGGGIDITARIVSQGLAEGLGQPAVVDNRGGGGGIMAGDMTAKALPDGYTLLVYSSNIWLLPYLQEKVPYDPVRDFAPITWVSSSFNTVVVNLGLPVKTIKELIAYGKANPGKLNYAHGGQGGGLHLAAELFKAMTGVQMTPVAYKANPFAFADLVNGQVQVMFAFATSVAPLINAGKVRAIAISTLKPSPLAPGLPTIAESGVPGYEAGNYLALFAPAKTPPAIIRRLNQVTVAWLKKPETTKSFFDLGAQVIASTPEELTTAMKGDMAKWGKIIKDVGIRGE